MHTPWPYTPSFFKGNRQRLTDLMEPHAMAVIFSNDQMPKSGDQYFPFRQNSDLFHQTGIRQEKTILFLFPNCPVERLREVLFIIQPVEKLELWEGKKLTREQAEEISGVKHVAYLEDFVTVLQEAMYYAKQVYLDSTENIKFRPDVVSRSRRLGMQIQADYPFHPYRRLGPLLTRVRSVKGETEIAVIKEACRITAGAFRRAARMVSPGINEYEVQAEIEHEFMINRASGHAFHPIIASGINATHLHYNQNQSICKDGDLLLMDFGCEYAGYASDLSRTIPVNGVFTDRQRSIYSAVLSVFKKAKTLFTAGQTIETIQKDVNAMMEEAMIGLGLFTVNDIKRQDPASILFMKYFPHGISHHVGLDVHDPGSKQEPLVEGMVITLEPGIYIPEEKTGIRIETDLLITQGLPVELFDNLETEPEEIEILLRK